MPENTGTLAGRSVARGVEGSGDAQLINFQQNDPLTSFEAARTRGKLSAAEKEVAKTAQDKAFSEIIDYAPEKAWEPFSGQVLDRANKYRNTAVEHYKKNGEIGNDFKTAAKNEQNAIDYLANKSIDIEKGFYNIISELKQDEEFDYETGVGALNSIMYNQNEETGELEAKDLASLNMKELYSVLENPEIYNMETVWRNGLKSFPEESIKFDDIRSLKTYDEKTSTKYSGRNLRRDPNDPSKYLVKNGVPVIDFDIEDINDPAKEVLMQNPKINTSVTKLREKYAKEGMSEAEAEKKIWEVPLSLMEKNISQEKDKTRSRKPEWEVNPNDSKPPKPSPDYAVDRSITIINPETREPETVSYFSPQEYTIGGKEKDKEISVSPRWFLNMETGLKQQAPPGSSPVTVTSVQLVPWNYDNKNEQLAQLNKQLGVNLTPEVLDYDDEELASYLEKNTDLKGEENVKNIREWQKKENFMPGHMRIDSDFGKETKDGNSAQSRLMKPMMKDPNKSYRWMAVGMYTDKEDVQVPVMIPYEDVSEKIKSKSGFSLSDRPFNEIPSEEQYMVMRNFLISEGNDNPSPDQVKEAIKTQREQK